MIDATVIIRGKSWPHSKVDIKLPSVPRSGDWLSIDPDRGSYTVRSVSFIANSNSVEIEVS